MLFCGIQGICSGPPCMLKEMHLTCEGDFSCDWAQSLSLDQFSVIFYTLG